MRKMMKVTMAGLLLASAALPVSAQDRDGSNEDGYQFALPEFYGGNRGGNGGGFTDTNNQGEGADNLGNHEAEHDLDMNNNKVASVADPSDGMDAVNLRTVEDMLRDIVVTHRIAISEPYATGPVATGSHSLSFGNQAEASGAGAIAGGLGAKATGSGAISIGSNANTQNLDSIAIGTMNLTENEGAIAIGNDSRTSGLQGVGIGHHTVVEAVSDFGVALGGYSYAGRPGSVALGPSAWAKAEGSVAIGYQAFTPHPVAYASVALGAQAEADEEWVVSVGSNDIKRRIINVGDPVKRNDAVTLGYLNSVLPTSDATIVRTTGNQTIAGTKRFSSNVYAPSFKVSSDATLKKNVETIDAQTALDIISKIRPVSYDLKENDEHAYGVIAQEFQDVMPFAVGQSVEGGKLSVDYIQIVAPLVGAVQELTARNAALEARVTALEAAE